MEPAKPVRPNPRKEFAAFLRSQPLSALHELHRSIQADYQEARRKGHCAMEAVLYFDLAQVREELDHRAYVLLDPVRLSPEERCRLITCATTN